MRRITKQHSTKPERIFYEILKELGIPFLHRWMIDGKEIDFVIGKYAIEINGHEQDGLRNHWLADKGYIPLHISNSELYENRESVKQIIKTLWQQQTTLPEYQASEYQLQDQTFH